MVEAVRYFFLFHREDDNAQIVDSRISCSNINTGTKRRESMLPKPSRNAQIVLRGFLRRDKSGIDAVSAYCLDIVAALKRGDVQLPLPSQAAEEALSSYLLRKNDDDDDDDSSSVTSFRSYVSSTNSYATMTTATTTTTAAREDVYESRLQAFNSVSTLDTRSLFGHSVIPDDESLFSSRRGSSRRSSRRSTSSSSTYDDDDDDDLHAPPGMTEKKEKKRFRPLNHFKKMHCKVRSVRARSARFSIISLFMYSITRKSTLEYKRNHDARTQVQRWLEKNV